MIAAQVCLSGGDLVDFEPELSIRKVGGRRLLYELDFFLPDVL
ncbi:hypothetical protein HMPREF0281_02358 [Corynebacterium ammoniagenes DSM 20306]|uniref:Uncharacterized protein n=1 Tax=Corynebacterium ammoniagenes DSM 20306 TaxID=649754 RepID=A0ABN0AC89_CORAM|nr:hypothetical protein HMPREF0281_02358 [Corynebacterium ammoniagenes DSM 20306]